MVLGMVGLVLSSVPWGKCQFVDQERVFAQDIRVQVCGLERLTPSNESPVRRCRGITVTSSISQRKATSVGMSPGLSGRAIVRTW